MSIEEDERLAAVVLARDRAEPTKATIDALLLQDPLPDVLILVANAASPDVAEILEATVRRHPRAEVLALDSNQGCSGGFEAGLHHVLTHHDVDYICGFDDDATPLPGCLRSLLDAARGLPDAAEIGAVSHDTAGTLAWPMWVTGEPRPAHTVADVRAIAQRRDRLSVPNLAWHGLMFPVSVLREHGIVWGDLFLQYEDIELGMRYRKAGLSCYLVPEAECLHPAPPPARQVSIFGRHIDVTAQAPYKEYLSLRNGLVVRRRHDGARFWYGTGPFVLLRGLLTCFALDVPLASALRHVFLQGIADATRMRLGPAPAATRALGSPAS
jgi:GT2 family glycosyltransferase